VYYKPNLQNRSDHIRIVTADKGRLILKMLISYPQNLST